MGRPELIADPRFATRDARAANVKQVDDAIAQFTQAHSKSEVLSALDAAGVPCAEVRDPVEAVRDSAVLARGETVPLWHPQHGAVEEVYGVGVPIRFSGATAGFDQPAPGVGEHNRLVYEEMLGYSASRMAELKSAGVI